MASWLVRRDAALGTGARARWLPRRLEGLALSAASMMTVDNSPEDKAGAESRQQASPELDRHLASLRRTFVRSGSILAGMAGPKRQRVEHPVPAPPPAARRHCWVTGLEDSLGPHAGPVVGWERRGDEWFSQVAYVIDEDSAALVLQWLQSELVRPAQV